MSLEYVQKKSASRLNKALEQPTEPVKEQPTENSSLQNFKNDVESIENTKGTVDNGSTVNQHFETWYNDKNSTSTIGELLDDPAFSEDGILDDVKDVEVRHITTPPNIPLTKTQTLCGYTILKDGKVVIYTNSSLPKEEVEQNLYHELQHARDIQDCYLNPNATAEQKKVIEEASAAQNYYLTNGDISAYKNSKYEIRADLNKDYLINKKKDYYDRRRKNSSIANTNTGRSIDSNEFQLQPSRVDSTLHSEGEFERGRSVREGMELAPTDIQGSARENPKTTAREPEVEEALGVLEHSKNYDTYFKQLEEDIKNHKETHNAYDENNGAWRNIAVANEEAYRQYNSLIEHFESLKENALAKAKTQKQKDKILNAYNDRIKEANQILDNTKKHIQSKVDELKASCERSVEEAKQILKKNNIQEPQTTAREPIDPNQPVHEQLNNSKGDLNVVDNIVENQAGKYIKKIFYQYNENLTLKIQNKIAIS
jgi:ElaB/YqjD/DUF883 family membrane-anchored ribosome-binding protein